MKAIVVSLLLFLWGVDGAIEDLKVDTSPDVQAKAVSDLILRLIPEHAHRFLITVDTSIGPSNKDTYRVEKLENDTVKITGTSGVAAATGFHNYLKYYCMCHVSWETVYLKLPDVLPDVNITTTSNDRFRYYQNVCTTSYSFVWWDWNQWEKHIDWMTLNSFNLVLSFHGQEAIWKRVYKKYNLTESEIDEHFAGPAFLSWSRMGNLRGWGGPLSEAWHIRSLNLQHRILDRMRELGIVPVLPAFAGHVPRAFQRLFPKAKMEKAEKWNRFNDTYCCPFLLDPTDPLFDTVGKAFLTELIAEFGTNHAYNCDTFNEMRPSSDKLSYIRDIGHSTYASIVNVDPKGVWIMQNWLFVHDFLFWTEARAEALLTSIPEGKMIVLDLQSEQLPQYIKLHSYYGQPYIWCMLHNFGGTLGMFGSMEIVNQNIFEARKLPNSTLIGTGITPEGINQNYVVYDLMNEMGWRKEPANLTEWVSEYATRRYGQKDENADKTWQILKSTVYNYSELWQMRGKYAINRRPTTRIQTWIWYDSCDLLQSWDIFLESANLLKTNTGYLHDLVDLSRQVLQVLGDQYYHEMIFAFRAKEVASFQDLAALFKDLLSDMDLILKTNEAFLLGKWLNSAKAAATDENDRELFEYNARNQITLWGPNGEIIDYASKQWSGIVSHFFLPRWSTFLKAMNDSLITGKRFKESVVIQDIFKRVEEPFTFDRSSFPDTPSGDTIEVAKYIHNKWWTTTHCRFPRSDGSKETKPEVLLVHN